MLPQVIAALLLGHPGAHASGMRARVACDTITPPIADGSGLVAIVTPGATGRVAWVDAVPTGRGSIVGNVFARDARGVTRIVGRRGAGPGEFRSVGAMTWRGDTLWVSDVALKRLQAFNESGKFLAARAAKKQTSLTVLAAGTVAGVEIDLGPVLNGGVRAVQLGVGPYSIVATSVDGKADTLLRVPSMPKAADQYTIPELSQRLMVEKSAGGEYWCAVGRIDEPTLAISCVTASGKPGLHVTRKPALRATSDAVWEGAVAAMMKGSRAPRADVAGFFHRPATMPNAFGMLVNRNGDLWLLRSHPSEPMQEWDRIRQDGSLLPPVTVPNRVKLRALDGNWYYAADTDSDDLQTLIRCGIPKG